MMIHPEQCARFGRGRLKGGLFHLFGNPLINAFIIYAEVPLFGDFGGFS